MNLAVVNRPYHLCFETLASDLRLRILKELAKRPLSVQEIAELVKAERSTVSHSLAVLKECSYVSCEKKGKENVYGLMPNVLGNSGLSEKKPFGKSAFGFMNNHIENFCHNECKKIKQNGVFK